MNGGKTMLPRISD